MSKIVIESAFRACWSSFRPLTQKRLLQSSQVIRATALPITAAGPPPKAPEPAASEYGERIQQKRKKAEMVEKGKQLRAAQQGKNPLKKRFWKDVQVKEVPEGFQIMLDSRPVRTPAKNILTIPKSKPQLAHAIAIEWDLLENAQQALKQHNIPMTSIASRALDIIEAEKRGDHHIRDEIVISMMRYLDTDTLLCWAPEKSSDAGESLRNVQKKTAEQIISYLTTTVWPGVEIKPVLDENSIMPTKQSEVTRSIIEGWMTGLPAFELAALERAVLATKSLLIGARLIIEWSEEFRDLQRSLETRFGIEEAALAATQEVRWQTGQWGEVEDTHDVDREDVRRQLGSSVLMTSGTK